MHTILGANGAIAVGVAKELAAHNETIRLVSRAPRAVNSTDNLLPADITVRDNIFEAVEGSSVVYLTAGFQYSVAVWEKTWPSVMRNVIDACKEHNARLVFFDNVYMYGKVQGWMTEETPMNPCSKKGEIRARIADMLLGEIRAGNLQALIARSADFYGPETPNSFFNEMVLKNLAKGKKAQLLVSAKTRHSMTYTRDAGKATALLGRATEAFGQIWHLPTDKNALTGEELTRIAAEAFGVDNRYTVLSKTMLRFIGLFNDVVKESVEMLYQNESDYLFDSSKFEGAFAMQPTAYKDGLHETIRIAREYA